MLMLLDLYIYMLVVIMFFFVVIGKELDILYYIVSDVTHGRFPSKLDAL